MYYHRKLWIKIGRPSCAQLSKMALLSNGNTVDVSMLKTLRHVDRNLGQGYSSFVGGLDGTRMID